MASSRNALDRSKRRAVQRPPSSKPPLMPNLDLFSVAEIQQACPGVSLDMIRLLLQRLKGTKVERIGRGHTAKWRRISIG